MRNLLLALSLALIAIPSFAQIDDIINKPAPKRPPKQALINTGGVFKYVLNMFTDIEISTLVDQMKQDGVTERKFSGVIGVSGRIAKIDWDDSDTDGKVLPFNIRLTQDNKMYLDVSAIGLGNYFDNTLENGLNPITHANFAIFKMDQGVEFRDIKTIGMRIIDIDIRVPLHALSSTRYIAIEAGGNFGGDTEVITLDNGQKVTIGSYEWPENGPGLAWSYTGRLGLALKEEIGKGTIEIKAASQITSISGGYEYDTIREDGNTDHNSEFASRLALYGTPSVAYRLPFKKTAIQLTLNGNIPLIDELRRETKSSDLIEKYDMSVRNRRPVQLGLKLTF